MEVGFADDALARLEWEPRRTGGYAPNVVSAFRKRMQFIRGAKDERDFRAWRSLNYKRLHGNRRHQHSMRLNEQYRLVLEVREDPTKRVVIIGIEDYH